MTTLPDIPRLYTALAEVLAALLYAHRLPPRMDQRVIWGVEAGWAVLLGAFLQATGKVPLAWWIPCMAMAILSMLLFLWVTRSITLLEAGYVCARAFILAELAASVEWQQHCVLWPQRGGAEPVVMALTAFAVSNLSFANGSEANMNMFYIRTLVDLAGVLILTVQHEQLREAALHSELAELDGVLHRQYEQYKQSKENIRLINRRYHELKMQIAAIRAERDHAKQDVALAAAHPKAQEGFCGMEVDGRHYTEKEGAGKAIIDVCTRMTGSDAVLLGQYRGFSMVLAYDGRSNEYRITLKGTLSHTVTLGADVFGNITRLDNALENLAGSLQAEQNSLEETKAQLENARTELATPFAREEELAEKTARLKELNILLNMDEKDKTLMDDTPDEGEDVPARRVAELAR